MAVDPINEYTALFPNRNISLSPSQIDTFDKQTIDTESKKDSIWRISTCLWLLSCHLVKILVYSKYYSLTLRLNLTPIVFLYKYYLTNTIFKPTLIEKLKGKKIKKKPFNKYLYIYKNNSPTHIQSNPLVLLLFKNLYTPHTILFFLLII